MLCITVKLACTQTTQGFTLLIFLFQKWRSHSIQICPGFVFLLHANKLSFNAVNSKFMLIVSPHSLSKLADHEKPLIKILGKFIEQVSSIGCLGMRVDQFLRWDKHVGALSKKKLALQFHPLKYLAFYHPRP